MGPTTMAVPWLMRSAITLACYIPQDEVCDNTYTTQDLIVDTPQMLTTAPRPRRLGAFGDRKLHELQSRLGAEYLHRRADEPHDLQSNQLSARCLQV